MKSSRDSIGRLKRCNVESHFRINKAFKTKLNLKKTVHYLQKIQTKYGSLIKYTHCNIGTIPLRHYPDLYKMFGISLINFKHDIRKYRVLLFFEKMESAIEEQFIRLKKKIRNYFYQELKKLRDSPSHTLPRDLQKILAVYERISTYAKSLMLQKGCPKEIEKDANLQGFHFDYIL